MKPCGKRCFRDPVDAMKRAEKVKTIKRTFRFPNVYVCPECSACYGRSAWHWSSGKQDRRLKD